MKQMIWRFLLACMVLVTLTGAAEIKLDSLTVGTRTYQDVRVIGANATDLYFNHSEGIANVRLKYLSPELQQQFNYDPKKGAEAEARQEKEDLQFQWVLASNVTAKATRAARQKQNSTRSSADNLQDPLSEAALVGRPAPALRFSSWTAEPPAMAERPILLYFWAPWSAPCRPANAVVAALSKKLGQKVAFVGVVASADMDGEIPPECKPDIVNALDTDGRYATAAGITTVPAVLLIDRDRKIRYQGHPAGITEAVLTKLAAPSE